MSNNNKNIIKKKYIIFLLIFFFFLMILFILVNRMEIIKSNTNKLVLDFNLKDNDSKSYKDRYNLTGNNNFFYAGKMNNKKASANMILLPNGNIVISGGYNIQTNNSFEIFDPNTGFFKTIILPAIFKYPRNTILLSNNEILINDAFVYNFLSNEFINIFNKYDYTNTSNSFWYSDNEIIIIDNEEYYKYNIKTKTIETIPLSFPEIANKKFINMNKNNILIYGIKSVNNNSSPYYITQMYLWDIKENSFKTINIGNISSDISIIKINDNEIIIFGQKYNEKNNKILLEKKQITYKLDLNNNKINILKNSNISRKSAPIALKLSNNKIFIIGGEDDTNKSLMTAELYDIKKNNYNLLNSYKSLYIPANRMKIPSIIEMQNKDLLICGGVYESEIQDKCIIYKTGD